MAEARQLKPELPGPRLTRRGSSKSPDPAKPPADAVGRKRGRAGEAEVPELRRSARSGSSGSSSGGRQAAKEAPKAAGRPGKVVAEDPAAKDKGKGKHQVKPAAVANKPHLC